MDLLEGYVPGKLIDIDPKRVRTMHAGIADTFSDGKKIEETIEALKKDPASVKHLPAIKLAALNLPLRKWERIEQAEMDPEVYIRGKRMSSWLHKVTPMYLSVLFQWLFLLVLTSFYINIAESCIPFLVCIIDGKTEPNRRVIVLFTQDHRRLVAAREAGVKTIQAQLMADPLVTGNYTTNDTGMTLEVRTYIKVDDGLHQGKNVSTFPSGGKVFKYAEEEHKFGPIELPPSSP